MQHSPQAATDLFAVIARGTSPFSTEAENAMGATDCPEGCVVECDGSCPHGFRSAAITLEVV